MTQQDNKPPQISRFIVIIRPEFMLVTRNEDDKKVISEDACRAAAFNHLLFRIAYKCKDKPKEDIQTGKILWYAKNEQITQEMANAWGVCKVGKEVNTLVTMGLLGRCSNPAWGVDRTKHFFFGQEQCAKFVELCEENNICIVHLDLPPEVKHLIYLSNANDKSIKCSCPDEGANDKSIECNLYIHPMHSINSSDAFDRSIEAIYKEDYKEELKDNNKEESVTTNETTPPQDETSVSSTHAPLSSEKKSSQDEETPREKPPTKKRPTAKKEPVPQKITLTPEEQTIYDYYCHLWFVEIPPKITEDLKSHCAKLHHSVKSQEDMDSLEKFARANNRFKSKVLYLGNLVNAVNGWRQMQPQKPIQATAPAPTAVFLDEQKASQLAAKLISSAQAKGHEVQARAIATDNGAFGVEVMWNTPPFDRTFVFKSEKRLSGMYHEMCQVWENSKAKVK